MRHALSAALFGLVSLGTPLEQVHAEAVKVSPHLTVFTDTGAAANANGPIVLRGSATKRGTVQYRTDPLEQPGPVPIGTGSTLWFGDPETGDIIVCEPRRESRGGDRYVDCFDGAALD